MFVLAHLSDPHLGPLPPIKLRELISKRGLGYLNWLRKRRAIHRADVLAMLVADLKARKLDHVAVTGDLVNLSLSNEFAPARAWLEALGGASEVTLVPGNHDAYVRAVAGHAQSHWGEYMRGDLGETFPFVRRRGPLALIGLSTSLPTLPLAATGRLGDAQLRRLADLLGSLRGREQFRVVLIHHPPSPGANRFRRLTDAAAFREVIPSIGVPSASGSPHYKDDPAGYNLYEIDGSPGAWRCTMVALGFSRGGTSVGEVSRRKLI
jgi:3',5'-cyclic AMP phosphodiesterase CpdA